MKFVTNPGFNNKPNTMYKVGEGKNKKVLFDKRSCAVSGFFIIRRGVEYYILAEKRGNRTPDNPNKWCVPCGYIDWNETGREAIIRETYEEAGLNLVQFLDSVSHIMIKDDLDQPWHVDTRVDSNLQNITLRFGCVVRIKNDMDLPELTDEFNEIKGEVADLKWINLSDISKYEWAFDHDEIIHEYLNK